MRAQCSGLLQPRTAAKVIAPVIARVRSTGNGLKEGIPPGDKHCFLAMEWQNTGMRSCTDAMISFVSVRIASAMGEIFHARRPT